MQIGAHQQYLIGSAVAPIPVQRLIVLIPDTDFNTAELGQHIWQLAISTHSRVLLFGICPDATEQLMLRRQLVTMAAAIRDNSLSVEIQVEVGKNWGETVEQLWQTGDLVIGLAHRRGQHYFLPVNEILNTNSQIPIYTLSILHSEKPAKSEFLRQAIVWSGLAGIMAAFFWGQVQISRLPQNWGQAVLLILSVIVEIVVLWAWNATVS
jgi:hypothetical protein